MAKKLTTEDFIKKSRSIHGDKYDYSKVNYKRNNIKVCIVCPEHGEFLKRPMNHFQGQGCSICGYKSGADKHIETTLLKKFKGIVQPKEYKLIPLTKGKFAKVDNEDFDILKAINWNYSDPGYAVNSTVGFMHRFIMGLPEAMFVDHINHDTLDNRRHNLRICTNQENSMNKRYKNRIKSSKFKGVYFDKHSNKWASNITLNGKSIYIGRYSCEDDAARAYDRKAKEIFGEFAYLNFSHDKETDKRSGIQ